VNEESQLHSGLTKAAERAAIIEAAADKIVEALQAAREDYGDTFKRNGAHLAIIERAKAKFREKPGRKPRPAAEDAA
jgi:hypothetical protein